MTVADEPRFRPLPAGQHGLDRTEVQADQARRLREAMVELIAEKGYPAVRIADLARRAHVSPPSLYAIYSDKEAVLAGAYEDIASRAGAEIAAAEAAGGATEERMRAALQGFAALAATEPKAVSLLVLGALGAGPDVLRKRRGVLEALEAYIHANRAPGAPLDPGDLTVRGLIGAIREITASRLREGRERELPEVAGGLVALAVCYPARLPEGLGAPPASEGDRARAPVSERARRASRRLPSGRSDLPPEAVARSQQERIVDATAAIVAEQGLAALTVPAIVKRASVSNQTFYSFYPTKHDAFLGAQKVGLHQALQVAANAYSAHPRDWPRAVASGLHALIDYLASEPAHARLTIVDTFAASPAAIETRDEALEAFRSYLAPGLRRAPVIPSAPPAELAAEAVVGGIWQILHDYVERGAARALPGIAPQLSYFALAPFIGADEAAAAALIPVVG